MPQVTPMALAAMPSPKLGGFMSNDQNLTDEVQTFKTDGDTSAQQSGASLQQIKISPPTQFDQTKPFMFNGHLVYPAPPGFQPPPNVVPVNMIGNPNFAPQALSGPVPSLCPPNFPTPVMNFPANPLAFPPGHQFPMVMPNASAPPENVPNMIPYGPVPMPMPMPVMTLVELTRSQIQGLRNSVNFIESQIANNNQQPLDMAYLQHQRTTLVAHISHMESMLEVQLAQENKALSVRQGGEAKSSGAQSHDVALQEISPVVVSSSENVAVRAKKPTSGSSSTDSSTTQQTNKTTDVLTTDKFNETKQSARWESVGKSRLTAAAAKAPPFQPRAQVTALQVSQQQQPLVLARSLPNSPTELSFETQAQIEARLLSKASSDWGQNGFSNVSAEMRHPGLPKAHRMHERVQTQKGYQLASVPRNPTFHGQANFTQQTMAPIISPQPTPYLVGVVPHGISSNEAKSSDLIYPRPLTDEEVRARYLYWGKAPRSAQHGLPKFDGKDFYPPSPVKASASMNTANTEINPNVNHVAPLPELDFGKLFTKSGVPGYKSSSSVHLSSNQPSLMPTVQPFSNNGIGGINEAGNYPNWSTQPLPYGEGAREPVIPLATNLNEKPAHQDDFTHLFLKSGPPGHKSPSPPRPAIKQTSVRLENARTELPVTPKNPGFSEEVERGESETDTSDSWGLPEASERELAPIEEAPNDDQSNNSTVEIHLSPQTKYRSPKLDVEGSFAERVASFSKYEYFPSHSTDL